ncbi:hypothetical protein BGX38DRAFT_1203339 [Terfezia claveryi]|nr:hypothetical protein BGX38DRAFT_1203339 [Terfezia claveryi]
MPPSRRPPTNGASGSPSLNPAHPVPHGHSSSSAAAPPHNHHAVTDDRDSRSEISGPTSSHATQGQGVSTATSTTTSKPRRALASSIGNGNKDGGNVNTTINTTTTIITSTTTTTHPTGGTNYNPSAGGLPLPLHSVNANGAHAHEGIEGISWHLVPLPVLHRYRHAYRLRVPSASSFYNNLILSQGIGKRSPSRAGYVFPSSSSRGYMSTNAHHHHHNHHHHPGLARDGSGLSEMSFGGDLAGEDGGGSGSGSGSAGRASDGGEGRRGRITREQLATVVRKNFNAQPISESDVIVNFLYSVKNQDKTFRLRFPPR